MGDNVSGGGGTLDLEGDYTTWTLKWVVDMRDPFSGTTSVDYRVWGATFIDEINGLVVVFHSHDWYYHDIYSIADGSRVYASPVTTNYTKGVSITAHTGVKMGSVAMMNAAGYGVGRSRETYTLMRLAAANTIEVWRGINKLWTHDISTDGITIQVGEISQTGRYVVVVGGLKLGLYEGS